MSDHFQTIYEQHAVEYDRLVSAEDCEDRLLPAIESLCPLGGIRVAEVGVGTGRVTRLLVRGGARQIVGVDTAPAMLDIAKERLSALLSATTDCDLRLEIADAAELPLADHEVDLFVEGWAFGHATQWVAGSWRTTIDRYLSEAVRVTRPGGTQILFETLGTGARKPAPPTRELAALYRHFEQVHGFRRQEIATDYSFESSEAAAQACQFFFGDELCDRIRQEDWARVPEWTGLWWRRRP